MRNQESTAAAKKQSRAIPRTPDLGRYPMDRNPGLLQRQVGFGPGGRRNLIAGSNESQKSKEFFI